MDRLVQSRQLIQALGEREVGFANRFHAYVSSDPSVSVLGTHSPKPVQQRKRPEESIGQILRASAAALREDVKMVKSEGQLRVLFIHLAARQGWRRPKELAEICEVTPRAIHWILNKPTPKHIEAAALCLGYGGSQPFYFTISAITAMLTSLAVLYKPYSQSS